MGSALALSMSVLTRDDKIEACHLSYCEATNPAEGRATLVEDAIGLGYSHMLWIDSDMDFKPADVAKLVTFAHGRPGGELIVGANYVKRNPPHISTATDLKGEPLEFGDGGTEEVGSIGMGLCVTSIDVFAKIDRPWFVNAWISGSEYMGEDVWLCLQARKRGIKNLCDKDIDIGHVGKENFRWRSPRTLSS